MSTPGVPTTVPPRSTWTDRLSGRGLVLVTIGIAGLWAAFVLDLDPRRLIPSSGGLGVARELLSRALSPALTYEAAFVPEGTRPLWSKALSAAGTTVVFAAAAMSLSLIVGLLLGPLASSVWWLGDTAGGRTALTRRWRRVVPPVVYGGVRVLIAAMRSVHELLWAVLFLAAFGVHHLTAVIAIAIPYGGTLAKVFSEMLDEAPRESATALRAIGASPVQVFVVGLLPRALPDMTAYAMYRFECALRSSAVMGFFGYPTLGYYLSASLENLHYGEVWTYLYVLIGLVLVVDTWSGAIRRRLVE
ncbi:MAG: ABC transporter permease subunit [Acidobacteriota bacterium]